MRIFCRCWFAWSTPLDRIRSYRKVGITSKQLRPDLINRAQFYSQADLEKEDEKENAHLVVDTTIPTPTARAGSKEYYRELSNAQAALIEKLMNIPCTPIEGGVLKMQPMTCQERNSGRARVLDDMEEYGSCYLKDMVGSKKAKRKKREDERERIDGDKRRRVEEKEKAESEAADLQRRFEQCSSSCTCGETPCRVQGLKRCPHCGDIKKQVCRKQACKAARGEGRGALLAIEAPPAPSMGPEGGSVN